MLGVLANHANHASAMDHFALVANLLYRCTYLHRPIPFCSARLIHPADFVVPSARPATEMCRLPVVSMKLILKSAVPAGLLVAVHDTAAIQVIRTQLDRNPVAGEDADEVLAHASGHVSQSLMLVLQLNPEHGIRQDLNNHCHHFNCIFLRQTDSPCFLYGARAPSSILPRPP